MYEILGKLGNLLGKQQEPTPETKQEPVYESVDPRGDIMEAVRDLEEKYMGFKKQELAEREMKNKAEFDSLAQVGDYYKTADGNKVTKTEKGIKHEKVYPGDDKDELDEKAVSKAQQQAAGAALAAKRGEAPKSELQPASKEMMKMSTKELEKFAGTKHKGLPKHVDEATEFGDDIENSKAELENAEDLVVKEGADIRNHPIYTNEEAWDHYKKELEEMTEEEPVDAVEELDEIAKLAGLAEKIGGNKVADMVKDITDEGFDPESYDKEIEYEFAGDDGEPGYGHVQCHVNVVDGKPVVDPASLTATCRGDGNNKLTDEWCSEMVAIGGSEHEEALKACQEEVEDEWESRDVDVPMDESAIEEAVSRKDFRMVADLLKNIDDMEKRKDLAQHHAGIFKQQNPRFDTERFMKAAGLMEDDVEEGNEFTGALAKAKEEGKKEFEVDGKTYKVKEGVNEDINLNVSANGEEDVVKLITKLAGMPVVAVSTQQETPCAEEIVDEEAPKERDLEYTNSPREQEAPADAAYPSGDDLNKSKKSYSDKPYHGDNPMAVEESKEDALWKMYEEMINDIKAD
jgi:cytochrome oxidase Cu insertion factor (SCO1/SenC/PrrC family)